MDEASKLVSDLQTRLKELDRKVWLYRRDMASEFTKYTEDLLRNVPKDVSDTVSKAIAASMKDCEALNPGFSHLLDSSAPGTDANGSQKSAPLSLQTSTVIKADAGHEDDFEVPRSPHEREKEFRGLFTPSYLPLLDSTNRNERRWSEDTSASLSTDKGKGKQTENMGVDAGTNTSRSLAATPEPPRPATPKRRNTDEVSIISNGSDGVIRRSALRRTSSSSKVHSPRRVRFEVAGEEVLPTVSPVNDSILSPDAGSEYSSFGDSDDEGGSEQVENIEDPPPKRISSSQALRALSRGPLEDDGTKWTVVSAPPDGSPSIPITNGQSQSSSTEDLPITNGGLQRIPELPETVAKATGNGYPTSDDSPEAEVEDQSQMDEDSSEDEGLDMKPRRPVKKPVASSTVDRSEQKGNSDMKTDAIIVPTTKDDLTDSKKTNSEVKTSSSQDYLKFQDDDDDVLFQFDEHTGVDQHQTRPNEDDGESDSDTTVGEQAPMNLSQYSRSPARTILWPTTSSTPKGSIQAQSWKGHPFSEPVVNEELHAQVASLGAVHSFVGSVDGRTGLDESDIMQSFRESLKYGSTGSFTGTPRSMSERMLLDDLMEAEEGKAE